MTGAKKKGDQSGHRSESGWGTKSAVVISEDDRGLRLDPVSDFLCRAIVDTTGTLKAAKSRARRNDAISERKFRPRVASPWGGPYNWRQNPENDVKDLCFHGKSYIFKVRS